MIFKCKNCGGNSVYSPELEKMFCPHCDSLESQERTMEECDKQLCPNCGGEIHVWEHTSSLKCGYCDHYIILNDRVEGEYAPRFVIPFKCGKDKVKALMREKFKRAIFAPTDFLSEVMLDTMEGDYVPYWMADYDVNCDYEAEGIKVRHWTSGDYEYTETSYYEVVRNMDIDYRNIPVDASVRMPDDIMDLLEPYDYSEMVDFAPEYMSGFNGEKYNMPFSDVLAQGAGTQTVQTASIEYLSSLPVDYNYDSLMMSKEDALFFVNLTQEGQFSVENTPTGEFKNLMQIQVAQTSVTQKTVEVTNQLTALIEKAQNTQKPVRITFDNDVSVVIKIDKNGKVTAEFIPGSLEVENYLRNNISALRQKFDEQNLPYNDLFYRQNGRQNKNKDKNNKGEQ